MCDNPKYQKVFPTQILLDISSILVPSTPLISLIPNSTLFLSLLILAKHRRQRFQEHLMQINCLISLDTYFVIDNFYYNDINMTLSPYILSRQKEILGL